MFAQDTLCDFSYKSSLNIFDEIHRNCKIYQLCSTVHYICHLTLTYAFFRRGHFMYYLRFILIEKICFFLFIIFSDI